jgi:hypothetical protein
LIDSITSRLNRPRRIELVPFPLLSDVYSTVTRSLALMSPRRIRVSPVTFEDVEKALRERLDALGPAPRAELLHVLMLPDFERSDRIGEFWSYPAEPRLRRAADRLRGGSDAQAVLVGMLREMER